MAVLLFAAWVSPVCADTNRLPVNDPDALRAALEQDGGHGTYNKVWQRLAPNGFGGADYNKVLEHIETGNEKWLKVADALKCCVDASTGKKFRCGFSSSIYACAGSRVALGGYE